jgi:hypothetical protein
MSNSYREFDTGKVLDQLTINTVNLNDFEMCGDGLARVVLSFTGDLRGDDFRYGVSKLFGEQACAVKDSFRQLTANSVVGYVSANRQVREYDAPKDSGRYRALASNILMDRDDQTTWKLTETESGSKYLCRHGIEDLSELAQEVATRRTGVPRISAIASAEVATKEFVAFVNSEREMDYGYAVGESDGKLCILSAATQEEVLVDPKVIVAALNLMGSDDKEMGREMAMDQYSQDKSGMISYYKQAYNYAPDYVQKIIEMINQHAFA